ncbi:hypothetical protein JXA40_09620 [bacterium]|nr:hypothetical protein [candidate division CSSED10-310 bacterium]
MVKVREAGERVEIFMKLTDGYVEGLLVMVMDGSKVTFVNIVGGLDMKLLGRMGAKFDIPDLDKFPVSPGIPASNTPSDAADCPFELIVRSPDCHSGGMCIDRKYDAAV